MSGIQAAGEIIHVVHTENISSTVRSRIQCSDFTLTYLYTESEEPHTVFTILFEQDLPC